MIGMIPRYLGQDVIPYSHIQATTVQLLASTRSRLKCLSADQCPVRLLLPLLLVIHTFSLLLGGIEATAALEKFKGGYVFSQYNPRPEINHIVAIVGWGVVRLPHTRPYIDLMYL